MMKTIIACIGLILSIFLSFPVNSQTAEDQQLIFDFGVSALLTEKYEEAEVCFEHLKSNTDYSPLEVHNNLGVNRAMWALSLLEDDEAELLIKYVFPFEVKPQSGDSKGLGDKARKDKISALLKAAATSFEYCLQKNPEDAGSYLNLASVQAVLSRWEQDKSLLLRANKNITKAIETSSENDNTRGFAYIVKGIIYDYLGNDAKKEDYFGRAKRQYETYPDQKLQSLSSRNENVALGKPVAYTAGNETYNVFLDKPETIEGLKLQELSNINLDREVSKLDNGALWQKESPNSSLFVFHQSENQFLIFHRTKENYYGASSKGIKAGDNIALVREKYGTPTRVRPAKGGQFLFYKKASILFFVDDLNAVKSWTVWHFKKSNF